MPSERIGEALLLIERAALDLGEKVGTRNNWRDFFTYFRKEWMKVVRPENFSIFKALNRTNNVIERYHRDLNEEMGSKPSPKHFIGNNSISSLKKTYSISFNHCFQLTFVQ